MSVHRVTGASKRSSATSRTAFPVLDAVVVRRETVLDTPEHGLSPAGHADLAVDRANVGLHGVGTQISQPRHVGVALALGDECEDLGLTVAEAFAAARPVQAGRTARSRRGGADHGLAR